jgi:hypothetical protein
MKNHKVAYFFWFLINVFMYGWVHLIIVNIQSNVFFSGQQGNIFLELLTCAIYIYLFSLCWLALQDHIKISKELTTFPDKDNALVNILNEFTSIVLGGTSIVLLFGGIFLIIGRFGLGAIGWLITGQWKQFSTCAVLEIFCSPSSNLLGLNNILAWIGNQDFLIFLIPLGFLLFWLIELHNKSKF